MASKFIGSTKQEAAQKYAKANDLSIHVVIDLLKIKRLKFIKFSGMYALVKDDSHEQGLVKKQEVDSHRQGVKANFNSGDIDQAYTGPERRSLNRRQNADRRDSLRFNEKKDRRSGKDRRKGSWDDHYVA